MSTRISSYFKFLLKSKNEHGVHSPFVFDLLTKCLYKKDKRPQYKDLNKFRSQLLKDNRCIKVNDFGAGSKVFSGNSRKISKIAQHVGVNRKYAKLLSKLNSYFQFDDILEIGTSLGIGTSALAMGNKNSSITTLEGCSETAKVAREMFNEFDLNNINLVEGEFSKTLDDALHNKTFDLIYFDGNHTKEATLNYFTKCLPHVHNDSLLLFDDIHWNTEMEEAWETIKSHSQVRVTIDTFQWGFVFLRKEQQKEHFTIRV